MSLDPATLRFLARSCNLRVQVAAGGADICFSPAGGISKGFTTVGLGDSPAVSEAEILGEPDLVVLTTESGVDCELTRPEVLEWVTSVLPRAHKFVADTLLKGAAASFDVLPTPEGRFLETWFAHDTHNMVLPREYLINDAQGQLRVRIARCPDCLLFFVGA